MHPIISRPIDWMGRYSQPVAFGDRVQYRRREWILLNRFMLYLLGYGPQGSHRVSTVAEFDKALATVAIKKLPSDFLEYCDQRTNPDISRKISTDPPAIAQAIPDPGVVGRVKRIAAEASFLLAEMATVEVRRPGVLPDPLHPLLSPDSGEIIWAGLDEVSFVSSPQWIELLSGDRALSINTDLIVGLQGCEERRQYRLQLYGGGIFWIDLARWHDLFWMVLTEESELVLRSLMKSKGQRLRVPEKVT